MHRLTCLLKAAVRSGGSVRKATPGVYPSIARKLWEEFNGCLAIADGGG